MKNAKIVKVCEIVVQVCNIAVIIAQAVKSAFPVKVSVNETKATPEDVQLIKDFLAQEKFQ